MNAHLVNSSRRDAVAAGVKAACLVAVLAGSAAVAQLEDVRFSAHEFAAATAPDTAVAALPAGAVERTEPGTPQAIAGEPLRIVFRLTRPASVTALVLDADDLVIRQLLRDSPRPVGTNTLAWDAKDDDGLTVPDEAYRVVLRATVAGATTPAEYDPGLNWQPQEVPVGALACDPATDTVRFELQAMARVRLRAGRRGGALAATLLDWAPRLAGTHTLSWDGRDASGVRWDLSAADFAILGEATSLPENTVVTRGNPIHPLAYWSARAARLGVSLPELRLALVRGSVDGKATPGAAASRDGAVVPGSSYLLARAPEFTLALAAGAKTDEDGTPIVAGELALRLQLSEIGQTLLRNRRYEVVFFVDGALVSEDETGYTPYTWAFDTRGLANGRHVLTVNLATLDGQVGSASIAVRVAN